MATRKIPTKYIVLAAIALIAIGAIGLYVAKDLPLRVWLDDLLGWLRGLGPFAFFACMALLPVFGFPMIFFSLSAGTLFAEELGLPVVILLVAASIAANITITYWLARYAIRPTLEKFVVRMGYAVPKVDREDEVGLAVLVRVTPGPPFFVQSYLLGLAELRFSVYFGVSWLISMSYALGLTFFGDALLHGKAKGIIVAVSLFVALAVLVRVLRRHFAKRSASAKVS